MLLHGIVMTFVIAIGSWCLAMTLAILLLAIRFSPGRIGQSSWPAMSPIIAMFPRSCS